MIGNAGDVNTGDFDPIERMADLAERYGAWLHVDGAFGLFARLTPRAAGLAAGVERAHSVISDGHKWLNVPYDCGFAFVRDPGAAARDVRAHRLVPARRRGSHAGVVQAGALARGVGDAARLRARRATGRWSSAISTSRSGWPAGWTTAPTSSGSPRCRSTSSASVSGRPGLDEAELDELNARLGEDLLADGRVYVGTTRYEGRVAFRPAIVNWRTTEADVDLIADVVAELGAGLAGPRH